MASPTAPICLTKKTAHPHLSAKNPLTSSAAIVSRRPRGRYFYILDRYEIKNLLDKDRYFRFHFISFIFAYDYFVYFST